MRWSRKKAALSAIRRLDPEILFSSKRTFDWMSGRVLAWSVAEIPPVRRPTMGRFPILGDASVVEKDVNDMVVEVLSYDGRKNHVLILDADVHEGEESLCERPSCVVWKVMRS